MIRIHSSIHCRQPLGTFLLLVIILFGSCSGCGQKTTPESPIDAPQADVKPIDAQQRPDGTAILPKKSILDVELQPIQLPPNYNPYYGKNYWGITENNLEPPPRDEFYADPLFWIPGWKIRTELYPDGNAETFLEVPNGEKKDEQYKKQYDALEEELNRSLTHEEYQQIIAEVYAEDLSNLHAAKYLGKGNNPYAVEYAQKAYDENPDDFHTLLVLAHLQRIHSNSVYYVPLAIINYRHLTEMNPNVARVHYEYAVVGAHEDIVPRKERIVHFEKSLELDLTLFYGDALRFLALSHFGSDKEKSIAYLKQWNVLFPSEYALSLIEGIEQKNGWRLRID